MKSRMNKMIFGLMASALLALSGCSSGDLGIPGDGNGGGAGGVGAGGGGGTGTQGTPPLCTTTGKTYNGFGGSTLGSDRVQDVLGADRGRVKPYSALTGEYMRVSSYSPPILTSSASTFGAPAANWYQEPSASAITIYTAYRASFQSCLQLTATAAEFSAAPTNATATTECTSWTRQFWSRDATPDELNTCTGVALTDTASETDVNKRWAYVCAAVMTSAGFLSY
ncbi:MAG: hypothetical protein ACRELY_08100 [Polyangiaceae bacterium]